MWTWRVDDTLRSNFAQVKFNTAPCPFSHGIKPSVNSTFNGFPLRVEMPTSGDLKSELSTLQPPAPKSQCPYFPTQINPVPEWLKILHEVLHDKHFIKFALINDEIIFVGE